MVPVIDVLGARAVSALASSASATATEIVPRALAAQRERAAQVERAAATRRPERGRQPQVARRALGAYAARHRAAQPRGRHEFVHRRERERRDPRVGHDPLARRVPLAAADHARARAAVVEREVAAAAPPARSRAVHRRGAREHAAQGHADPRPRQRGEAQRAQRDLELPRARIGAERDTAARHDAAPPRARVVEGDVGVEPQVVGRAGDLHVPVERAAPLQVERRRELVDDVRTEPRHGDVGRVDDEPRRLSLRVDARQRCVADDRRLAIPDVRVGQRERRRVAADAHRVPQRAAPRRRHLRIQPPQIRERDRRAGEIQPEAHPAELDRAVAAHARRGSTIRAPRHQRESFDA